MNQAVSFLKEFYPILVKMLTEWMLYIHITHFPISGENWLNNKDKEHKLKKKK